MRPCISFLRRESVLEVGHKVVFLFHQRMTFCKKCKLCNLKIQEREYLKWREEQSGIGNAKRHPIRWISLKLCP